MSRCARNAARWLHNSVPILLGDADVSSQSTRSGWVMRTWARGRIVLRAGLRDFYARRGPASATAAKGLAFSRTTSRADLSSRRPWKEGWRNPPSCVHSAEVHMGDELGFDEQRAASRRCIESKKGST